MTKTQINAIKRIINLNKNYPSLQGVFIDASGRVCAFNSYYGVRLNTTPPEDIPRAAGVDITRFFDEKRGDELIAPSFDAIRYYIRKKMSIYDFGDDLPRVNAKYLLDILRIFPDARIYTTAHNPKNKAIFFESARGDGLLLPIRK